MMNMIFSVLIKTMVNHSGCIVNCNDLFQNVSQSHLIFLAFLQSSTFDAKKPLLKRGVAKQGIQRPSKMCLYRVETW